MLRWAFPTISSTLYQPLDLSDDVFRTLTLHRGSWSDPIRCSIRVVSLTKAKRRYHALSYRWGDENTRQEIIINEKQFSVTINLHTALKHLRLNDADRDLWVDQICINQGDEKEKMHQIRLMKPIYVGSSTVIIWLGESDRHSDRLAQILSTGSLSSQSMRTSRRGTRGTSGQDFRAIYNLILHICQREWWPRVWVVQECVLPVESPIFQCGHCSFTFTQLEEAFQALMREPKYLASSGSPSSGEDADLQKALNNARKPATDLLRPLENMITLRRTLASRAQRTISLIDCLQLTVSRSATNPHDHVYGFLGLMSANESRELNPNASISTRELFRKFMTLALRSSVKNDKLGCYQALRMISFEQKDSATPSWVPDLGAQSFSNRSNSVYLIPAEPAKTRYYPDVWFEANDMVMNMVGFYLDTITHTQLLASAWQGLPAAIASCQDRTLQLRKQSKSFFRRIFTSEDTSNESTEIGRVIFRRLFTCNFMSELPPGQPETLDELWDLWIRSKLGHSKSSREELGRKQRSLGTATIQRIFADFHERSSAACEGRCWLRTTDNHVGIAVPSIRAGDVVMLPRGFVMPLVLRPSTGSYKLIGVAYIDGLAADGAVDRLVDERGMTEKTWKLR
ncbi:heterokaryon incompatibility protein-domain-containing protein [Xylariales sp. AK1849]|nr:heterokaryon incompatibility protein-domain-containing protein [Xylariales sp. AK1849]